MVNYTLSSEAISIRKAKIAECREKIREVETVGAQRVLEAANKRREQYWEQHADERIKLEHEKSVLQSEMKDLKDEIGALTVKKESVPSMTELRAIRAHI